LILESIFNTVFFLFNPFSAQASANSKAVASSLAQAYANAIGKGCSGASVDLSAASVAQSFASAASSAQAAVTQEGAGSTQAAGEKEINHDPFPERSCLQHG
jgi:hypothetical protein